MEPQVNGAKIMKARGAGDSVYRNPGLSPANAGCGLAARGSWGFATLHPRLYALARCRGLMLTGESMPAWVKTIYGETDIVKVAAGTLLFKS
jgi:hypothetical protein